MHSFLQKTLLKRGMVEHREYSLQRERLKQASRISRNTFHYILQKVGPAIWNENTGVGSISPDERLAITLYKLGRRDYNYFIGEMTGYAESTVSCLITICQAIIEILWEESVTKLFPKREEDFRQALIDMESEWQLKFTFSAIHTY